MSEVAGHCGYTAAYLCLLSHHLPAIQENSVVLVDPFAGKVKRSGRVAP